MTSVLVPLRIRLLGQPQLHADGVVLALRAPPRALSLLVYLLLHRERAVARDSLAFTFWPDVPEADAFAKLRAHLHAIRKSILPTADEALWLLADKRTVQWNPQAPAWLDLLEFEKLAADPARAGEAVDLYGGDLASGLEEDWLEAPRQRLRERQTALLAGLVRKHGNDDSRRALDYAQRLVLHDPWHEEGMRALMTLRYESGDRTGALQAYRDFAKRLQAELGVDPMAETTDVYRRISVASEPLETSAPAAAMPVPADMRPHHNLPAALTTFVGRELEIENLRLALKERRLVTLTGAAGVGKSRLAVETARTVVDRFPDGAWLVELAPLTEPGLIVSTIASALGLESDTETALLAVLRGKNILLVLDNCEHLIATVAATMQRLLGECPQLHVLATSREPLQVSGERTERIGSLALPEMDEQTLPSIEELRESPAVRLFLDRAADAGPAMGVPADNDADRRALTTISRRLDGIPLAIEFAAARAGSLSLDVLARRLDDRFALLDAGKRTTLPRQQTLRATLDWSYDLLTELEQRALQRIGIFVGGSTLEAAASVCSDDLISESQVVDLLSSLVDKSLVVVEMKNSEPRYRLLEATRDYALERLVQAGDHARVARRHAEYFYGLARCNDTTQGTADSRLGITALSPELDNFRSAVSWTIEDGNDPGLAAFLIESLRWFFAVRSLYLEGVRLCEAALAALGPRPEPVHEAAVQLTLAAMMGTLPFYQRLYYHRAHDVDRFLAAAERAAELLRMVGEGAKLSIALSMVAMHLRLADRRAEADPVAGRALEIGRGTDNRLATTVALYAKSFSIDPAVVAERTALLTEALEISRTFRAVYPAGAILVALGELAFETGDPARGLAFARESAAMFEAVGSSNMANAKINIAAYALALGDLNEASAVIRDVLAVAERAGDLPIAAAALQHAAGIAAARGEFRRAAQLLGASDRRQLTGLPRLMTERSGYDKTRAVLGARLAESELAELFREGHAWALHQAVDHAMAAVNAGTTVRKR
jgi:predicted ATPase/DNA-binding SARP family transcriptional activator